MPKFCKDCVHYIAGEVTSSDVCDSSVAKERAESAAYHLVRGEHTKEYCTIERLYDLPGRCGPQGKFWLERERATA